jgi:hypothetical protein
VDVFVRRSSSNGGRTPSRLATLGSALLPLSSSRRFLAAQRSARQVVPGGQLAVTAEESFTAKNSATVKRAVRHDLSPRLILVPCACSGRDLASSPVGVASMEPRGPGLRQLAVASISDTAGGCNRSGPDTPRAASWLAVTQRATTASSTGHLYLRQRSLPRGGFWASQRVSWNISGVRLFRCWFGCQGRINSFLAVAVRICPAILGLVPEMTGAPGDIAPTRGAAVGLGEGDQGHGWQAGCGRSTGGFDRDARPGRGGRIALEQNGV